MYTRIEEERMQDYYLVNTSNIDERLTKNASWINHDIVHVTDDGKFA